MAIIRAKDIGKMSKKEREEKIMELKAELIKNKIEAGKGGKLKAKEIKKTIARLLTLSRLNTESADK
jgi:ribosomal protein L29